MTAAPAEGSPGESPREGAGAAGREESPGVHDAHGDGSVRFGGFDAAGSHAAPAAPRPPYPGDAYAQPSAYAQGSPYPQGAAYAQPGPYAHSGPYAPTGPTGYPGNSGYAGYAGYAQPEHPSATITLVMAILGFFVSGLTFFVAWYLGSEARKEIMAGAPYPWDGSLKVGYWIGKVGGIVTIVSLVFAIVVFALLMLGMIAWFPMMGMETGGTHI